jgi:hypothetical protein
MNNTLLTAALVLTALITGHGARPVRAAQSITTHHAVQA